MEPSDLFIAKFGDAAKQAAIYELRLRLLAANQPPIVAAALAHRLEETEDAVMAHFATDILPSEVTTLQGCRRVRNKFLHADFAEATARIRNELGGTVATGFVFSSSLETGEITEVGTSTTAKGTLYGWLVEGAQRGGVFEQAEHAFLDAIRVVLRLREVALTQSKGGS